MPDPQVLDALYRLRQSAGLSQADVARIIDVRRKTISDWETGKVAASPQHRTVFLRYLLETLKLADDVEEFLSIWRDVCQLQWGWDDLQPSERWILELSQRSQIPAIDTPSLPPYLDTVHLFGRKNLLSELRKLVKKTSRIGITGMPGVGKTALALALAQDPEILEHFRGGILWASLGPRPTVLEILNQWIVSLGREVPKEVGIQQRAHIVRNAIGTRRVLIFIDDAWEVLPALHLACGGPNCSHVLMTRLQSVAHEFAGHARTISIPELTRKDGVELLAYLVPSALANVEDERVSRLVDAVGGLPLALVLLGGFLASPEYQYFPDATNRGLERLAIAEERLALAQRRLGKDNDLQMTVREVIELSLEFVHPQVRQAFFGLGAFAAKPAWFSRAAAEQITGCNTDSLAVLIDRNLLEIGRKKQLAMHQVLADFARMRVSPAQITAHRDYYLDFVSNFSFR